MRTPDFRGMPCTTDGDPDLFFPISYEGPVAELQTEAAKQVCRECPGMGTCLAWALEQPDLDGVFGATTPAERAAYRRSTQRQLATTASAAVALTEVIA